MVSKPLFLGMDLGGTNLRAALFRSSSQGLELLQSHRAPLNSREPQVVLDQLAETAERLAPKATALGIGVAGMVSRDGQVVLRAPNLDWTDLPLATRLGERLHYPCYCLNDLNAISWGEFTALKGARGDALLCVFLGTGVGAGIITEKRLLIGSQGVAGEIGHTKVVFDEEARLCGCGRRGCLEAYLGGKNFIAWMEELLQGPSAPRTALTERKGPLHPGVVDAMARVNDPFSLSLIQRLAQMLGRVLANAVTLLDPGTLLLGGTVWEHCPLLRELTIKSFETQVNPQSMAKIVSSSLGDDAGLYGAANWALTRNTPQGEPL